MSCAPRYVLNKPGFVFDCAVHKSVHFSSAFKGKATPIVKNYWSVQSRMQISRHKLSLSLPCRRVPRDAGVRRSHAGRGRDVPRAARRLRDELRREARSPTRHRRRCDPRLHRSGSLLRPAPSLVTPRAQSQWRVGSRFSGIPFPETAPGSREDAQCVHDNFFTQRNFVWQATTRADRLVLERNAWRAWRRKSLEQTWSVFTMETLNKSSRKIKIFCITI